MNTFLFENINIHSPDSIVELKNIFETLLNKKETQYISFINPEIFMQQQNNLELHKYFEDSTFNFIDGIGLLFAINHKCGTNYGIENRYPGTDFFEYLPERNIKIFFYGSKPGNAEIAKKKIEEKYPNINIVGTQDGYTKIDENELIEKINCLSPDILIVCTGCPKQELWIKNNLSRLCVPVVFGNGGAIDFWSESVKRAPSFMINHGLEWLYRLFQNFTLKRISRQSKLFSFLIKYKFNKYMIEKK